MIELNRLPKRPPTFAIKLVGVMLDDWVISVRSNLSKKIDNLVILFLISSSVYLEILNLFDTMFL